MASMKVNHLKRREFITLLGGAATWPLRAQAQQPERMRRIGVLMSFDENDPTMKLRVSAFTQALADLGWTDGRNVRMDLRWGRGDINRIRALAQEVVGLKPDIILTGATPATLAIQRETRTIPIIFASVSDPVASGIVARLDRPSGNITGFPDFEATLGGKWLELLSEIAPGLKRAAIMFNPDTAPASAYMPTFEAAARALGLPLHVLHASTERDLNAVFETLLRLRASGLVIASDTFFATRSEQLAALTVRHAVPAIHQSRDFTTAGGLMSYGGSFAESHRQAGVYTGRIIKGDKPADLPVQQVTKVELFINLKAAKTLGVSFPLTLLGRADQVIE